MLRVNRVLLVFLVGAALLRAECGINKPFKIYVQKSYHADDVVVPTSGCRTAEGPCKASGTVFIVSTKKVKFKIFLVDGADGNLEVGGYYSAFLSCGKNPMMTSQNNDGKPIATFYVLDQEAEARR